MKKILFIFLIFFAITLQVAAAESEHDVSVGIQFTKGWGGTSSRKFDSSNKDKLDPEAFGLVVENHNAMWGDFGFMEKVALEFIPGSYSDDSIGFYLMAGPAYQIRPRNHTKFQFAAGLQMDYLKGENHSFSSKTTMNIFHMGLAAEARVKFTAHKNCSPVVGLAFGFDPIVKGEHGYEYEKNTSYNWKADIKGPIVTFTMFGQFCFNIK